MNQLLRLVPSDWPWTLRCSVESVLFGWLLVVIPTVAVYLASSSLDAAAALSLSSAVSTGTGLWAVGFGGVLRTGGNSGVVLGLPLLGLTVVQGWWTWGCVGRAKLEGILSALWVGVSSAVAAALLTVLAPAASRTWTAVLGLMVLNSLVALMHVWHDGVSWKPLADLRRRTPRWLGESGILLRLSGSVLLLLAVLVTLAAGVSSAGRISHLHDALAVGNLLSVFALVLLQVGWLPTVVIWSLAWLVGPGFVVGQGSTFSPGAVVPGAVPALPILGGLPTDKLSVGGALVPGLIVLVGLGLAWYRRNSLQAMPLTEALYAGLSAAALSALAGLVLCCAASGPIGPGRMEQVGPQTIFVCLLLFFELAMGLLVGILLVHPRVRQQVGLEVNAITSRAGTALGRETSASANSERVPAETDLADSSAVTAQTESAQSDTPTD